MATPVTTPPSSAPPVTPTEQDFTTSSTRRHARQTTQDSDAEGAYDHTGDIGHDRLLGEQVDFKRDRRSREKGKGRMIIEEERGDDDDDDDDDGDAGPTVTAAAFPPEQGDQDEREAKRIADVSRPPPSTTASKLKLELELTLFFALPTARTSPLGHEPKRNDGKRCAKTHSNSSCRRLRRRCRLRLSSHDALPLSLEPDRDE